MGKQPRNLVDKRLNCVSPSLLFINRHFWENESSDEPPDYLLLCSPRPGPRPTDHCPPLLLRCLRFDR